MTATMEPSRWNRETRNIRSFPEGCSGPKLFARRYLTVTRA